ncbi:MAG: transketolase [Candidatus Dadabacteria bacterium]|nr:MAG: transketolase [Candidatus Dadabacteria bacterium]
MSERSLPEPLTPDSTRELALLANTIRQDIVRMVTKAASGHPGGPLGLADIYAVLFRRYLRFYPEPNKPDRDRFILSNAHVCAVAYSVIARMGAIEVEELDTFRRLGSRLQGHPSPLYFPWIENAGGSLGQGLSFGVGTALANRLDGEPDWLTWVAMSDGECQEGMTWEAAMSAAHYRLRKLIAFVDYNRIQIDGHTDDVMSLGDLHEKFKAFGWLVRDADGHDLMAIDDAFRWAVETDGDAPRMILFRTILGKGVSFMEDNPKWHGSPPSEDQCEQAIAELEAARAAIG